MNNQLRNIGVIAMLFAFGLFFTQDAEAQAPGDIDLSREYCDPIYGQRPNQQSNLQGYYPFSQFGSIIIRDNETNEIVWQWQEDCDLIHKNTYKHLLRDYEKEPIDLKPGVEYNIELNVENADRLGQSNHPTRVYYDKDESETFEQFDDDEYIFWSSNRINDDRSNPGPDQFCNDWQWSAIGWNGGTNWITYNFDWVAPNDGLSESRMRFHTSRQFPTSKYAQNACQGGWDRGRWKNPEYGQTIDQTVLISCPPQTVYPNETEFLFAGELYNNETRVPKRGGAAELFAKPSATFGSVYDDGSEVKISIVGPLPSQTEVYQATDANDNIWQDVSLNGLRNNNNFELFADESGFVWNPKTPAKYEGDVDGWVTDALGNPLSNGGFNAFRSGSYALRIEVRNSVTKERESCSGFALVPFSIKANRDIAATEIVSPRNYDEPFYRKYQLQNPIPLEFEVKNIGLTDINEFVATVTIKDPDGDVYLEDEFNYDKDNPNQTIMRIDDTRSVGFAQRFTPQEPGLYSVVYSVVSAEGRDDWDESRFNNHLPRPSGGTAVDGFEFENEYIVEIAYSIDLVGGEVLFPAEEPISEETAIIQNRPFRPIVRFLNNGIQDATTIFSNLEVRDENGDVVAQIEDFEIEDMPAGRFNFADVRFPEITISEAGEYTLWARVDNVNEPFAVVNEDNEVTGKFTVEPGISGVYTVGMAKSGNERNYNTIAEAMQDVYYYGMSGDVTYELTDQNYVLTGIDVAWDFRSKIIGLGYNENIDETFTMTWKPSPNRSFIRSGVNIEMRPANGKGVAFGQAVTNEMAPLAPINSNSPDEYSNFGGYVTFDGGDVKSLRFVMNTNSDFATPFYLGAGSHNVTLKNLIIENIDNTSKVNKVRLPLRTDDGKTAVFEDDLTTNEVNNNTVNITYSAGIALRSEPITLEDILDEENEEIIGVKMDPVDINNISITGNEISDFGYGIMSLGIGGIYIEDELSASYENFNNRNNTYENNIIDNVGRAGIALGNEEMSTVKGNVITNVNPLDVSNLNDGTGSFDHAGIMIGGLTYETADDGDKAKGASAREIEVNGNRINNVNSDVAAYGVKVEQNYIIYDQAIAQSRLEMPDGPENMLIANNVIQGLNLTNANADKYGIRLFTERENFGDLLTLSPDYPGYRTRNDKIVNNTIIIDNNENGVASNENVFAIAVQQGTNTEVFNNAIAISDQSINRNEEFAAAVFLQTPLPSDGGPLSDNNAYYISANSGAATVKLAEMDDENNTLNFVYSRYDFENLDQWSIFTGSDENSIEYNFLNDVEMSQTDVDIKTENGLLPKGSKLNNRGRILSYLDNDKDDDARGVTGERYDIGAEEFKGRLFTSDVEMVRIASPSAYKATIVDPVSGNDFRGSEHIMTTAPINVTAQVRNDGSLSQVVDVTLTVSIESNTMTGEYNEFATFVDQAIIASTNDVIVDFKLDEGSNPWVPETYSDYNNNNDTTDNYMIPARYAGMSANVTPRIKLEVQVGSDENNGNNRVEKVVRFYLTRTNTGVVLSTVDNSAAIDPGVSSLQELGGRLNTQQLRQGFLTGLNWRLDASDEEYDYDLFDRNGWERRSVNYDAYNVMFWADGGDNTLDNVDRYQTQNIADYLAKGTTQFKVNLISASQGLATNLDPDIASAVFGLSTPTGVNQYPRSDNSYLNDPAWKIVGASVSEDRKLEIDNPSINPQNYPALDPMPIIVNPVGNVPGRALKAYTYEERDMTKYPSQPTMGVAYTTLTSNVIYLGAEWRHISDITLATQGLMDYINSNGGFVIPVELSNFDANQVGNKVMIEWATMSEENSSHFVVEKALENDAVFTKLTTVAAQGNKSTKTNYEPVIDASVKFGETYLYKLKTVDIDGSWEYSETVDVTVLGSDLTISEVKLSPNPTNNGVTTLEFFSSNQGDLSIEVYDMAGNLLLNDFVTISGNLNEISLDLGNVANGVYNVVISSGEYRVTRTLNVSK